jgi:chemotaxis protein methyltransferase WspC
MALREGLPSWAEGRFPLDGEVRRADADVLSRIRFHRADLFAWTPAGDETPFDIVFCRNVLIYLQQAARRRLVAHLDSWLATDGLLFVGHADAATDLASRFRALQPIGAFVFERIGNPEPSPAPLPRSERGGAAKPPARRRPKTSPAAPPPARSDYETAKDLRSRGRLDEAEPLLRRLLRRRPGDVGSLLLLGEVLLGRGQPEEAEAVFQKLVYLDPDHEIGLLHLAEIAEHAGRLAQADRYRERALNAHLRREGEHEAP